MLKPGEIRILKALEDGPLGNVELTVPADLKNSTIRSKYLRNLLKLGLIARDIDPPRKYRLIIRGSETLFLIDLISLIEASVGSATGKNLENAGIDWWQLSPIISEDTPLLRGIMRLLLGRSEEGSEIRWALSRIMNLMDSVWRRNTLGAFSVEERTLIEDYMDKLSAASWLLHGDGEEEERIARDRAREVAGQRLARLYPGIKIPLEIVQAESKIHFEGVMARRRRILASLCPDVEAVKKALVTTEQIHSILAELNVLVAYLEKEDRRKLYEEYLEKVRSCPRSLIISPSSAFREYREKYKELFNEGAPGSGF